jgi:protein-S-isoprenylcysteine O-methyltransferase Ste14
LDLPGNGVVAVVALALGLGTVASGISVYRHFTRGPDLENKSMSNENTSKPAPPNFWQRGGVWVVGQVMLLVALALSPWAPWAWAGLTWVLLKWPLYGLAAVAIPPGLFLLIAGFKRLGPNLTALPRPIEKGQHIVTGIYRHVRHPIYGGVLLLALAYACLWNRLAPALVFFALATLLHFKSRAEERFLMAAYPGYEAYRKKTKALFPGLI